MRRGFWVVLGLAAVAPVGALAQEGRVQSAEQAQGPEALSVEVLQQQINELWQALRMLQQEVAELRAPPPAPAPAVGGAGQAGTAGDTGFIIVELPEEPPAEQRAVGGSGPARALEEGEALYVGTVRAVTPERLLMVDRLGRVFEFDMDEQTRVVGPEGASLSVQALEEGTPVSAVARQGEVRSQVHTLHLLMPAPVP